MQRLRNLLARRPECAEYERPGPFLRIQPIRRIRPSRLMARLARIFGEKVVTVADGATPTCYWWRGICYVEDYEETEETCSK